jgi:hypothetical protein
MFFYLNMKILKTLSLLLLNENEECDNRSQDNKIIFFG